MLLVGYSTLFFLSAKNFPFLVIGLHVYIYSLLNFLQHAIFCLSRRIVLFCFVLNASFSFLFVTEIENAPPHTKSTREKKNNNGTSLQSNGIFNSEPPFFQQNNIKFLFSFSSLLFSFCFFCFC